MPTKSVKDLWPWVKVDSKKLLFGYVLPKGVVETCKVKVSHGSSCIFYIGTNKGVYRAHKVSGLCDAKLVGPDWLDIKELKCDDDRLYATTVKGEMFSAQLYLLSGDR